MPKYLTAPAAAPTFATDPVYSSGPKLGTPVRANPGSGSLAAGFYPDDQPPAQIVNYLLGALGDSARDLAVIAAHAALQRWTRTVLPPSGDLPATHVVGMVPALAYSTAHDTLQERARLPVLFGPGYSGYFKVAVSADGSVFEASRAPTLGTFTPLSAAHGAPGAVIIANGASHGVLYSLDHGSTFSYQAFGSNNQIAVHYAAGPGKYLVLDNKGQIATASAITSLSSGAALPGVTALSSPFAEFADDGGLNCVLTCEVDPNSVNSIYCSADGGVTWSLAQILNGELSNVVYSKSFGCFVSWDYSGDVWTSPTGSAWTQVSTGIATRANGILADPQSLAAVGPVIAKLWRTQLSAAGTGVWQRGIAYSFDLGLTWNVWAFGEVTTTAAELIQLKSFNNRLYCVDLLSLWISGQLGSPLVEF